MERAALPRWGTLFADDFEEGASSEWIIPNGGWQWEDGRFYKNNACGFQSCDSPLFAWRSDWTNVTVKLDFTPASDGVVDLLICMDDPSLTELTGSSGYVLDAGWGDHAGLGYFSGGQGYALAEDWSGAWHIDGGVTYTFEFGKFESAIFARFYVAIRHRPIGRSKRRTPVEIRDSLDLPLGTPWAIWTMSLFAAILLKWAPSICAMSPTTMAAI
ncbi:MAG: hypothetical protein IPG61_19270 [bacterium]|nr:hypothetical protein [bacterium]